MLSKPMRGARPNRQHWSAKGLVGEWLFNEGCGTKAFDSSGNGNHGTLINMASPSTASSGWGAGRRGVGLRFDGTNDYVNCGNDSSLDVSDAITIEAWVKGTYHAAKCIINKGNIYFNYGPGYQLLYAINPKSLYLCIATGSDKLLYNFGFGTFGWTHLGFTRDSLGNMYAIKNGVLYPIGTLIGDIVAAHSLLLGIGSNGDTCHFNGAIDEVRIYNRAVNAEEIAWNYINEYAKYQPRLTLTQLRYFVKLGVITDPSIELLSVNRTMKSKTIDRTFESLTPERTFNLGV